MRLLVTVCIAVLLLALVSVADEMREKPATAQKVSRLRQVYNSPATSGYNAPAIQATRQKTASMTTAISSPENYALNFISSNSKMFGISNDDLRLTKKDYDKPSGTEGDGLHYIFYEQMYKGIPVFSSSLGVVVSNGKIVLSDSTIYRDINISTIPVVTEGNAAENVMRRLNIEKDSIEGASLVIFLADDYRLAWKIETAPALHTGDWTMIVDAQDGAILAEFSNMISETLTGNVTGTIYPEYPSQQRLTVNFSWLNVTIGGFTNTFYSGSGNNLNNYMRTANRVNLSGASRAELSFLTRYDTENSYDVVYVDVSYDGLAWALLKSYTGSQPSWAAKTVNLSGFMGSIFVRFRYVTDSSVIKEGFYADNISIVTDLGTVLFDNAESGFGNWNVSGFSIAQDYVETASGVTNENGTYTINSSAGNYTFRETLKGPFVKVIDLANPNPVYEVNLSVPSSRSWNWNTSDYSYNGEASNVFYHANRVHDYFTRGSPFNITSMNYQARATVQYPGTCNAYSNGTDIFFTPAGGGCDSTALSSDVIYHEYTHGVHHHVYGNTFAIPSGAVAEGLADYFAAAMNNNACMVEEVLGSACLRNLNNTLRTPYNLTGGSHADSRVFSGALWDMRTRLGAGTADNLTMMAMKMRPISFADYLTSLLVADDNNTNLYDGTPHWDGICESFYTRHGIESFYCYDFNLTGSTAYMFANSTDISVPDFNGWVSSAVNVPHRGKVKKASAYAGISHTYIGDLLVNLTSPSGRTLNLHNRSGRDGDKSADNIYTWYDNETLSNSSARLLAFINEDAEGTWALKVADRGGDDVGFIDDFMLELYIDKPPSISVVSPANNSMQPQLLLLNVTVDEDVLSCSRSIDSGDNVTMNNSGRSWYGTAYLDNSSHSVRFHCTDAVNNTNSTDSVFFTVADTTAPNISFVPPSDPTGSYVSRNYTFINASVADVSGIDSCLLDWDGITQPMTKLGSGTSAICFINKSSSEGSHNYTVYVNDTFGNMIIAPGPVITFDTIKPSLDIAFPTGKIFSPNNDGVLDDISFNVTVSEIVNFDTIYIIAETGRVKRFNSVEDATSALKTWNGSCTPQYCSGIAPDGSHNIEVNVVDRAGNRNGTNFTGVILDTKALEVQFVNQTPLNETLATRRHAFINVTTSEEPGSIQLEWNGANETMNGAETNWFRSKLNLPDGNYTFRVYVNDSAGNRNASETRWVFINATKNATHAFSVINQSLASRNITFRVMNATGHAADISSLLLYENYTLRFNASRTTVETIGFSGSSLNLSAALNISSRIDAELNLSVAVTETGGTLDSYVWVDLNNFLPEGSFTAKITFPRIYALYFYLNGTKEAPAVTRITDSCDANISSLPCYSNNITANTSALYLPSFSGGAGGNDTQAPSVSVSSPSSTTYSFSSISLNYTASDNIAVSQCWYSLNNAANISLANCTNTTITAAEGINTLIVYANDTSNNTNYTAVTFSYSTGASTANEVRGGGSAVFPTPTPTATATPAPMPQSCATRAGYKCVSGSCPSECGGVSVLYSCENGLTCCRGCVPILPKEEQKKEEPAIKEEQNKTETNTGISAGTNAIPPLPTGFVLLSPANVIGGLTVVAIAIVTALAWKRLKGKTTSMKNKRTDGIKMPVKKKSKRL